jgi:hypothetical protein
VLRDYERAFTAEIAENAEKENFKIISATSVGSAVRKK